MPSITVTSDTGSFKAGAVLKAPKAIAKYHRLMMDTGREPGEETKLTDEQIMQVVNAVDGDGEAAELDRLERLEAREATENGEDDTDNVTPEPEQDEKVLKAEPATADAKATEVNFKAWAIRQAAPFAKDETFKQRMLHAIKVKKESVFAPLPLMGDVRRLQPDEAIRKTWPLPGSKQPDGYKGNDVFDIVKIPVTVDGEVKDRRVSFYEVMFDAIFPNFKSQANEIKEKAPGSPYGKDKADDKRELSDVTTDLSTGRANLRKAVALDRQYLEVKELPGMLAGYVKEKDGSPKMTNLPIILTYAPVGNADPTAVKKNYYSISEFLRMDPDAARDPEYIKDKGGVYEALVMSGKQEPESPTEKLKIKIATFAPVVGLLVGWARDEEHLAAWRRSVSEDNDKNNHEIVSVIDFYLMTKEIAENPGYWRRYLKATGQTNKDQKPATPAAAA